MRKILVYCRFHSHFQLFHSHRYDRLEVVLGVERLSEGKNCERHPLKGHSVGTSYMYNSLNFRILPFDLSA